MVLLLGVNFPEGRLVKRALETFFGIGKLGSAQILARHHIHPSAKIGSLKNSVMLELQQHLTGMKIENDLKKQILGRIKLLRDIKSYRGMRHALGLPVRGQNTRSQIQTSRKLNRLDRRL